MARYSYFVVTFSILPVLVIAGVLTLYFMGTPDAEPSDAAGLEKDLQLYLEVRQKLIDHYDGELDDETLRNAALQGLAQGTGDNYTRVLPPVAAQAQSRNLGGSFFGVGVNIEHNDDGSIRVTNVQPGGGGEKAGLLVNDVIVSVDGDSILGMSSDSNVNRIKGDVEGSVVKLGINRGGDTTRGDDPKAVRLEVEVARTRVETHSVHDIHIEERNGRRFGYMHISDCNANTFDPQFKNAIAELADAGAEGFVIDLRGNGGGRVSAAVSIVDGLIDTPDAMVVFTRSSRESNRAGDAAWRTKDAESITSLPIVLLVDDGTASAAEIIAGALKDHGRAFVIGVRTFGKGVVQTIHKLSTDPNYALNITTTQYFTPLGRKVNKGLNGEPGGIQPDLEIPYRANEKAYVQARLRVRQARFNREQIAESSRYWNHEDRMLEAALDVLSGKPVTVKD